MTKTDSTELYKDGSYLEKNPGWHAEDAPFKAGKILQLIEKNGLNPHTICDLGCGTGDIIFQLSAKLPPGTSFRGFDISSDAISLAKNSQSENIQFEIKDVMVDNEIPVVDLLLVIDVIEHIENYFQFLRAIASGGRFTIFHIPLDLCMWSLFREKMLLESKESVGHIHNFTEEFIRSVITDNGFKIIDRVYTEPMFPAKSVKQKIARFSQRLLFKINKRFCSKTIGGISIMVLAKNPEPGEQAVAG